MLLLIFDIVCVCVTTLITNLCCCRTIQVAILPLNKAILLPKRPILLPNKATLLLLLLLLLNSLLQQQLLLNSLLHRSSVKLQCNFLTE